MLHLAPLHLIHWMDHQVLFTSTKWVSTGADNAADKLFISNILGVPCNHVKPVNSSKQRWIDNYSHRVDGGTLHVRNFRFGES